jgi:hypothetical protein
MRRRVRQSQPPALGILEAARVQDQSKVCLLLHVIFNAREERVAIGYLGD